MKITFQLLLIGTLCSSCVSKKQLKLQDKGLCAVTGDMKAIACAFDPPQSCLISFHGPKQLAKINCSNDKDQWAKISENLIKFDKDNGL